MLSGMLVKRAFDLTFSVMGIVFLSPIFLIAYICVVSGSKGGGIFKQERIGERGRPFILYKFRTMYAETAENSPGCTGVKDKRITGAGKWLRKYKLDEIPQLINVLRGDMSFVGPRPELFKFVEHYPPAYGKILMVKPGITDLASIEFRNEAKLLDRHTGDIEEYYIREILPKKLAYSMRYIEERNFFYDIKLIFRTIFAIFTDKTEPTTESMESKDV